MEPPLEAPPRPSALRELAQTLTHYVEARLRLFQIESQEAGGQLLTLAVLTVCLLGSLLIAWMIAVPAVIWLIAQQVDWHWSQVALATAGLHLLAGFAAFFLLKRHLRRSRFFEESIQQFKHDRAWLAPKN